MLAYGHTREGTKAKTFMRNWETTLQNIAFKYIFLYIYFNFKFIYRHPATFHIKGNLF